LDCLGGGIGGGPDIREKKKQIKAKIKFMNVTRIAPRTRRPWNCARSDRRDVCPCVAGWFLMRRWARCCGGAYAINEPIRTVSRTWLT
jgi:hypothetical protein